MLNLFWALPFTYTCQVGKTLQDGKRSGYTLYLFAKKGKKDAASILNATTIYQLFYKQSNRQQTKYYLYNS